MNELGNLLKKTREAQNKTLTDMKDETRIQEQLLTAIENGDYHMLPSRLHAYGFVKRYAEALGLKYDEVKALFESECPKDDNQRSDIKISDANNSDKSDKQNIITPPEKKITTSHINQKSSNKSKSPFVIVLVLALIVGSVWYISVNDSKRDSSQNVSVLSEDFSNVPPIIDNETVLKDNSSDNLSLSVETIAAIDNKTTIDTKATDNKISGNKSQDDKTILDTLLVKDNLSETPKQQPELQTITIFFAEECWLRFSPDNKTASEYLSPDGTNLSLQFETYFALDVGNASAVTIKYKDQEFADFGPKGAVRKLRYFLDNDTLVRIRN